MQGAFALRAAAGLGRCVVCCFVLRHSLFVMAFSQAFLPAFLPSKSLAVNLQGRTHCHALPI